MFKNIFESFWKRNIKNENFWLKKEISDLSFNIKDIKKAKDDGSLISLLKSLYGYELEFENKEKVQEFADEKIKELEDKIIKMKEKIKN